MKTVFVKVLFWKKVCSGLMAFILAAGSVGSSYAQTVLMSAPGTMVPLSAAFAPPLLKGIKVYPEHPFRLDFILDRGGAEGFPLKKDAERQIKYFLASVTVPEADLWVNLSPYEQDRIIPEAFGVTEMGRDLLAQDYLLKQITASVIYPEGDTGKMFWSKVYAEAQKKYGTSDIPIDTFNKVWIIPEKAVVYESKDSAYIVESKLKVMLETDYLAATQDSSDSQTLAKQVLREVVIPILEKEINEGENFSQLRQVYHSLILAVWYKDKVKESVFGKSYVDQNKTDGVDIEDKAEKEKIWGQYVEAFKKGAYNYIKEDFDPAAQQMVPKKYFSGGAAFNNFRKAYKLERADRAQLSELSMLSRDPAQNFIVQANLDAAQGERDENKAGSFIIQEIAQLLASVNGKRIRRKDVTPQILWQLSYIKRDGKPVFTQGQIKKVGNLVKLRERLTLLEYLFNYKKVIEGKQTLMFQGTHIVRILQSSRSDDDIRHVIKMLKGLGITENSSITSILQSARSKDKVRRVIGMLKDLGITESRSVAKILQSSRSKDDIRNVIRVLKELGITGCKQIAMILQTSRSDDDIRGVVRMLKTLRITESRPIAMILYSSRSGKDILKVISMLRKLKITEISSIVRIVQSSRSVENIEKVMGVLKALGITKSSSIARILQSSRSGTAIREGIEVLKSLGITESNLIAIILQSSRSEDEMRNVIGVLKDLGITENRPIAMILHSARSEDEILSVIRVLKHLGVIESRPTAIILQSSRSENEIRDVIKVLRELGITESRQVSMILQSSRSEAEIRDLIGVLKALGITENIPVAMILQSSRSENEIRKVIGMLGRSKITASSPVAIILQSSRSEVEILNVIGVLKELGITESRPVAMTLYSSRSEEEIRAVIGVLKELRITESKLVAMILQTARSYDEIRKMIGVLKTLGITENRPVAMIVYSSRSVDEIVNVIGILKDAGITENSSVAIIIYSSNSGAEIQNAINLLRSLGITEKRPVAMILQTSRVIEKVSNFNGYKRGMQEKKYPEPFIQEVLLYLALSKSPGTLFDRIMAFDFNAARVEAEQMPLNTNKVEFEHAFGGMGVWLLKFLGKDFRSLRAVIRGYAKEILLLDLFPENISLDRMLFKHQETDIDRKKLWHWLEPLIASLSAKEQEVINAFLEGTTADELGVQYPDIPFQGILNKLRGGIVEFSDSEDVLDSFDVTRDAGLSPEMEVIPGSLRGTGSDLAMTTDTGGVDLTREMIGLQVQNEEQGVQFELDFANIPPLQNGSGLTPVIINIQPMTITVSMFLGIDA